MGQVGEWHECGRKWWEVGWRACEEVAGRRGRLKTEGERRRGKDITGNKIMIEKDSRSLPRNVHVCAILQCLPFANQGHCSLLLQFFHLCVNKGGKYFLRFMHNLTSVAKWMS